LNSGVNDRRGRGFFFATVSILDILSGALAHLVDVRQTVPIPPQVPAKGGGTKDRSRNEDGRWHEKRSDAGKTHKKSK
jgi:hypothetical protein